MIHGFLLIYMLPHYNKEPRSLNNGHGYTGHGSAGMILLVLGLGQNRRRNPENVLLDMHACRPD